MSEGERCRQVKQEHMLKVPGRDLRDVSYRLELALVYVLQEEISDDVREKRYLHYGVNHQESPALDWIVTWVWSFFFRVSEARIVG